ncbi:nucleoid occlusion factor SlmA [Endozoicomonas sp. 8E]|uniref:nucleoid occlusion factor SlmA n=1 Tax=Endozoicomonas sp. 8E TaxID=3035692 RepID=UPI002939069A|nr:nucleoid occlusion factor SlmA [Endozoicomonas sp. 8E]WOG27939.1 nucleoid occlusion factor SlmA [Endozoicomonas sp. 8E]
MDKTRKFSRKDQILQALAHMLENAPGERITTSSLAREVGVSEAALYRHFPSKAKMFEGLIEFIEDTLFSRVNLIMEEEQQALRRCGMILQLLLGFCEKNPGLTRILTGDALAGEPDRLRQRVFRLFDRLETQIKQVLRGAELSEGLRPQATPGAMANMLLSIAEGRICQYVRSEFKRKPTEQWLTQWEVLATVVFR